jgi:hypothetical protein
MAHNASQTRFEYLAKKKRCLQRYEECRKQYEDCPPARCPEWVDQEDYLNKRCGPDITDWLISLMKELADRVDTHLTAAHERNAKFLAEMLGVLKPGGDWDWKRPDRKKPWDDCSVNCPGTVFLCERCVNSSAVANMLFGFASRVAGLPTAVPLGIGHMDAKDFDWPKHDELAVRIGTQLGRRARRNKWRMFARDSLEKTREWMCDLANGPPTTGLPGLQKPDPDNAKGCRGAPPCGYKKRIGER